MPGTVAVLETVLLPGYEEVLGIVVRSEVPLRNELVLRSELLLGGAVVLAMLGTVELLGLVAVWAQPVAWAAGGTPGTKAAAVEALMGIEPCACMLAMLQAALVVVAVPGPVTLR